MIELSEGPGESLKYIHIPYFKQEFESATDELEKIKKEYSSASRLEQERIDEYRKMISAMNNEIGLFFWRKKRDFSQSSFKDFLKNLDFHNLTLSRRELITRKNYVMQKLEDYIKDTADLNKQRERIINSDEKKIDALKQSYFEKLLISCGDGAEFENEFDIELKPVYLGNRPFVVKETKGFNGISYSSESDFEKLLKKGVIGMIKSNIVEYEEQRHINHKIYEGTPVALAKK